MPLTEKVTFKTMLQRGNRVQVPKLVRWLHKMEPTQILKVTIAVADAWDKETFIARMGKDGRIAIPKLTRHVLQGKDDLHDYVLEVNLEPAEPAKSQ